LLIGDTSVGKSSLIHRYADGEFLEDFVGTAGVDHKEKNIEHLSKGVKMRIWDSAGQERFRETTKSYFRRSVGIILVYDVTNARSFENIDYWLQQIEEHSEEGTEIVLLGNKIDLINEITVDQSEAVQLAEKHNITYFGTSAKEATNLDEAFKKLLTSIIENDLLKEKIDFHSNIRLEE